MIHVVYNRPHHRLTVVGHAGSAPHGEDLVCAAVSGLVLALGANVHRLQELGVVRDVVNLQEDGGAEIACKCKKKHEATVALIFDVICLGLSELAEDYPEFITMETRG